MAAKTKSTKAKASSTKARTRKVRFDNENGDHWHTIPSKGQLFALAVASFNGAKIDGACFGSRELAKAAIAEAKENGDLD
jgi:hypothetical protein